VNQTAVLEFSDPKPFGIARSPHADEVSGSLGGMRFVLVHSPLVGPTTWRWTTDSLSAAGHEVVVPDLRDAAAGGRPDALIAAAVAQVPSRWISLVVVGHSGAGSFLPSVSERLGGRATRLVFVDAGLPPHDCPATPSGDFLDQLRALAVDGVLPRWSAWWGDGVMEMLVNDADRRADVEAEMREIPLAFFESAVKVPRRWWERPGAFLLLSEAYHADAERARSDDRPSIASAATSTSSTTPTTSPARSPTLLADLRRSRPLRWSPASGSGEVL
jgi:pimeloyl-ACP methyl ester carboxylesterase